MALITFQVLNSHMWLVATILDNADMAHVQHHRTFYWRAKLYTVRVCSVQMKLTFPNLP